MLRAQLIVGLLVGIVVSLVQIRDSTAQRVPDANPEESKGTTEMPISLPGGTEVLGVERAATSSQAARLPLERPVDPDAYVCGPGDVFELNFWGKQNFRLRITADLEGRTFISKVGFVKVAGKSLTVVRGLVKKKVRRQYPGLRYELNLTQPRTFLVHVIDNVEKPGAYTANPLERVSAVLSRAGGAASRRRIEIRRSDGTVLGADLLLYERTGDTSHNPYVLDGDIIHVPFPKVVVSISGPVRRPGTYELIETHDLDELLELAGGFRSSVTRKLPLRLIRRNKKEQATYIDIPFAGANPTNRPLRDDDSVVVRSTSELQRTVLLIGAVIGADPLDRATTSKRLAYIEGDTVRSLLERAGGIRAPGDLHRSYISRRRKDQEPELIPIDLEALMVRRDFSVDKPIKMGDTIVVPRMRRSILVEGAVVRGGVYDYNPLFSVPEYIANAGGRTRNARGLGSIKVVQPTGTSRRYKRGMAVNPGDTIMIPERNYTRAQVVQLVIAGAGLVLSAVAVTLAARR